MRKITSINECDLNAKNFTHEIQQLTQALHPLLPTTTNKLDRTLGKPVILGTFPMYLFNGVDGYHF